jgi:hypothetical protein
MKPFELFMGCLGNGLTVCNKAVMEHNDYKQIAHISPAGNIKWYIPVSSVPGPALLRIEHTADAMYHNFKSALERDLSTNKARTYFRMLNALSVSEMVTFINTTQGEPEDSKVEKLKALYLKVA